MNPKTYLLNISWSIFFLVLLSACTKEVDDEIYTLDKRESLSFEESVQKNNIENVEIESVLTIDGLKNLEVVANAKFMQLELGLPIVQGAVGSFQITNNAPKDGFEVGKTYITWMVVDSENNKSTSVQTVVVLAQSNEESVIAPVSASNNQNTTDPASMVNPSIDPVVSQENQNNPTTPVVNNPGTTVSVLPVEDPTPPVVMTQPLTAEDLQDLTIELTGEFTIPVLPPPKILGGVSPISISNDVPESGFAVGSHNVTWQVIDAKGATLSLVQVIHLLSKCDANARFFKENVWPVLNNKCIMCHNLEGSRTPFNLLPEIDPDFAATNYSMFEMISKKKDLAGLSMFLVKPTNINNDHGGGTVLKPDSVEISHISTMVDRLQSCAAPEPVIEVNPLVLLTLEQTLRKASLVLVGRIPSEQELVALNGEVEPAQKQQVFLQLIDNMMTESAFIENVKIIFNDKLLTNTYASGARGLGLALNAFDNKKYFDNATLETQGYDKADRGLIRSNAGYGVAMSAIELIAYIVENDKPFTEILTADYVMVNPYSATIFGANIVDNPDFSFTYGDVAGSKEKTSFIPTTLIDKDLRAIPHAGVLSTLPFLSRFPSTSTNLNRKRAATIFKIFLDTDIEGLASRTALDLDNVIGEFPTLEDPQCKACHDVMDPVAGLLKNWTNGGEYRGDYAKWGDTKLPPEMLSPGFSKVLEDALPSEFSDKALVWLAQRIAADNRFAISITKLALSALVGQKELNDVELLERLKSTFIDSNYNFKELVKSVVLTEYFRADAYVPSVNLVNLDQLGSAHLLTPEQLNAKVISVTGGYEWKSPSNKKLTDRDTYNILYGGIDSQNIITRTAAPTGIMAAIQERLAFQTSCETTPLDFSKPAIERVYYKLVEITDLPADPASALKIKENIQFLFSHILGELHAIDSVEVLEVFNLFAAAIEGSSGDAIPSKCRAGLSASDPIIVDENKTVRAWMAVLSYLYLDYKFLYQ